MTAHPALPASVSSLADTHEVINVSRELADFNAYTQDTALREAVGREGAGWAHDALTAFGRLTGSADSSNPACWPTATRPSWTPTTASALPWIWSASLPRIPRC